MLCVWSCRASPEWDNDCWGSEGRGVQHWDGGKVALGETLFGNHSRNHSSLMLFWTWTPQYPVCSIVLHKVLISYLLIGSYSARGSVRLNDWMLDLSTSTCGKTIAVECLTLYDSCSFFIQGCWWKWHVSATQPRVWLLHGMKMGCLLKLQYEGC